MTQSSPHMTAYERELQDLQRRHTAAFSEGRFEESAGLQTEIARVAARQEEQRRVEQQWTEQQNQLRQAPLVEQFLSANRGLYTAAEEQWIRQHPQYAEQPGFQNHVVRAHNEALQDGIQRGSNHYFARLDRAAAKLVDAAAYANQPLGADEMDIARSTYAAIHPDAPAASDSDVQRYWNQQKHSDNAYRIKENWVA